MADYRNLILFLPITNAQRRAKIMELHSSTAVVENCDLTLMEIAPYVHNLSMKLFPSKYVMKLLRLATASQVNTVANYTLVHTRKLSLDYYGNNVIQLLIEMSSDQFRSLFAKMIFEYFWDITLDKRGYRVISQLIKYGSVTIKNCVAQQLTGHVMPIINQTNSLITYCLVNLMMFAGESATNFICNEILPHIGHLIDNQNGVRIIESAIRYCSATQVTPILDAVQPHLQRLITSRFGNYIASTIAEMGRPEDKKMLLFWIKQNFMATSIDKHGSHVIENFMKNASFEERLEVLNLFDSFCFKDFKYLLRNNFGNYVVQAMLAASLKCSNTYFTEMLVYWIHECMPFISKYTFHVLIKQKVEAITWALGIHDHYNPDTLYFPLNEKLIIN